MFQTCGVVSGNTHMPAQHHLPSCRCISGVRDVVAGIGEQAGCCSVRFTSFVEGQTDRYDRLPQRNLGNESYRPQESGKTADTCGRQLQWTFRPSGG